MQIDCGSEFWNNLIRGICYFEIILLSKWLLVYPIRIIDTFGIEEYYGFNKYTPLEFIKDGVKEFILLALLYAIVGTVVLCSLGSNGSWLIGYFVFCFFYALFHFLWPSLILPLFFEIKSLGEEHSKLESMIQELCVFDDFPVQHVSTIDIHTSHTTAFITGFGKLRRICILEQLLVDYSEEEIISVIAHEMGHWKLNHMVAFLFEELLLAFPSFLFIGLFALNKNISQALFIDDDLSTMYTGLIACWFFLKPIIFALNLPDKAFSRRCESDADMYSCQLMLRKEKANGEKIKTVMLGTMEKLVRTNLMILNPSRLYVTLYEYHPAVLDRVDHCRSFFEAVLAEIASRTTDSNSNTISDEILCMIISKEMKKYQQCGILWGSERIKPRKHESEIITNKPDEKLLST